MERLEQAGAAADRDAGDDEPVTCSWCESRDVERLGEFGPGLMTEQWFCRSCHSAFEWIRKR